MKTFKRIIVAVSVAIILWLAVSYIEVIKTNQNPDTSVSDWNYFEQLMKGDN